MPGSGDVTEEHEEPRERPRAGEAVTTLELFFDLIFVFAVTQVTGLVLHDPTARGLVHGVVVFLLLWWAWGAYAWLTNNVAVDELSTRLVVLASMATGLVLALAVPTSFTGGGTAFGLAYLVILAVHLALFVTSGENPAGTRAAILAIAPTNLLGGALLIVGAQLGDGEGPGGHGEHGGGLGVQTALWVAAIVVCYVGPYVTGVGGFTLHPSHFAERHGLIVIVALGESIIAIGAGGDDITVDRTLAGTALVAIALVIGLWWLYFDTDADRLEHALTSAEGAQRATLARDVYSYLHVPLVLGVVFAAVGIHDVLVHPGDALDPLIGGTLAAGVGLYVAALTAARVRCGLRPGAAHLALVGLCVAAGLVAPHLPSWVVLAGLGVGTLVAALVDDPPTT